MKTTIDIPEDALTETMRFARARTKREAILTAVNDYNRRNRMAALTRYLGTCKRLITPEELAQRREMD